MLVAFWELGIEFMHCRERDGKRDLNKSTSDRKQLFNLEIDVSHEWILSWGDITDFYYRAKYGDRMRHLNDK